MEKINVIALGPKSSGKTVYLGNLYKSLSVPWGMYNFYIETQSMNQGNELLKIIEKMFNHTWPKPTDITEDEEFIFNCIVQGRGTAFQVSYLDYTGERWEQVFEDNEDFKEKLNNADCLMGIIDGQKLYHSIKNNVFASKFTEVELFSIIKPMGQRIEANVPVHFIISKWDVLEGKISLEKVKEFLLKISHFKSFVEKVKEENGIVRLIPVSSVGFNFAKFEGGEMQILENATIQPFNVHIPFALTLLDRITIDMKSIEEKITSINRNLERESKPTTLERLLGKGASAVYDIARAQHGSFLGKFLFNVGKTISNASVNLQLNRTHPIKEELEKVRREGTTLEYVLISFREIEKELVEKFPNNII